MKLEQAVTHRKLAETKHCESQILFARQELFQHANKPGRCLGNLLNPRSERGSINTLYSSDGKMLNTETEKLLKFVNFYKKYIRPGLFRIAKLKRGIQIQGLTD